MFSKHFQYLSEREQYQTHNVHCLSIIGLHTLHLTFLPNESIWACGWTQWQWSCRHSIFTAKTGHMPPWRMLVWHWVLGCVTLIFKQFHAYLQCSQSYNDRMWPQRWAVMLKISFRLSKCQCGPCTVLGCIWLACHIWCVIANGNGSHLVKKLISVEIKRSLCINWIKLLLWSEILVLSLQDSSSRN